MPFRYAVYNVQDMKRSAASHEAMNAMEADGWEPHEVSANFAEISVLWRKPLVAADEPGTEPAA
jgi:hypothetical protein